MGLAISARLLIKFLEYKGFRFVRSRGTSHNIYSNGIFTTTVAVHKGLDVDRKQIKRVLYDCKISELELKEWLGRSN